MQDVSIWPLWPLQLWSFEMGLLFAGCMYAVQSAEQIAQKKKKMLGAEESLSLEDKKHLPQSKPYICIYFTVVLILLLNLPQGIFWLCSGETLKEALEPAVVSIGSPDVSPHKAFRLHGYSIAELLSPFTVR